MAEPQTKSTQRYEADGMYLCISPEGKGGGWTVDCCAILRQTMHMTPLHKPMLEQFIKDIAAALNRSAEER